MLFTQSTWVYLFAAINRGDKLGGGDSSPQRVPLLLVVVYYPAVVDLGVLRGGQPGAKSDFISISALSGELYVRTISPYLKA